MHALGLDLGHLINDDQGGAADVELRFRRVRVLPPIGKQKRYPALPLTVIHAREPDAPGDRPAIDWKLITDLRVTTCAEAVEKLRWYALRWKVEVFHNILKAGCRAEEARLRTAERLVKLIAVFCILSWRVFWMTMLGRSAPEANPSLAFTDEERAILDRLRPNKGPRARTLSSYRTQARPPWRLSRTNQRPATRDLGGVARPLSAHRHHAWRNSYDSNSEIWVIGSLTGCLPSKRSPARRCSRGSAARYRGAGRAGPETRRRPGTETPLLRT